MIDRSGQQLGNYHLSGLLGRGGFAEVYLGEHIHLKTQAAIKILQTHLSSPQDQQDFLKEAQTVAHLSHPHIVRILDFGMDGQTPFLVMDYAPSGTLRQRHRRGERLQPSTVIQYVKQMADALQYAHDEKVIHRDIKPENMLVGKRNEIVLGDFGIAIRAQSSRYQSTQNVIGTVAYMSPEQIQGKPRPASDQYALGIVVYEWLSGKLPFSGSFTEVCTQHLFAPVPSLHEKVPTISSEMEHVVMMALAKDPTQRFNNVQAFATELEQACQMEQPSVSDVSSHAPTILPGLLPTQPANKPGQGTPAVLPSTEPAASAIPTTPVNAPIPGKPTHMSHKDSTHSQLSPFLYPSISAMLPAKTSEAQPVVKMLPDQKPSITAPKHKGRNWLIAVVVIALMIIVAFPQVTHAVGNCKMGTGYNASSGTVEGESSTFFPGNGPEDVYLVCQIAPGVNPNAITDHTTFMLSNGSYAGPLHQGQIDSIHNVYYSKQLLLPTYGSSSYVWQVAYYGIENASVSYQEE